MKSLRPWLSVLPASALVFSSCGEKEQEKVASAAGEVAEKIADAVTPDIATLSAGERAAMLGIVGHLSKDTESVMAIYDGREIVNRLRGLKTWTFLRGVIEEEEGVDPEDEMAEAATMAGKFAGQEMFIAMGEGTVPQYANLLEVSKRSNYYQMRVMAEAFVRGANEGDLSGMDQASAQAMMGLTQELGKEVGLIESASMPPMLLGVKAEDEESLGMAQENLTSSLESIPAMLGEAVSPVEFTKGGVTMKGYKLAGTFVAEQMEQARGEIEGMLEASDVDRLIATMKTKNLVVTTGTLDNYVLLYVGDNVEACPLAESIDDSLAANDAISFVDGYKDKKVVGFLYGEEGLAKASLVGSLKDMALGIRDGIAGAEGLGDTRDLASLLEMIGEKEDALIGLATTDTTGGLVVLEDGVKFELFGGIDRKAIDYTTPNQLGALGGGDDVLLFSNSISTPEYSKRAQEYGEAIVESAYAMVEKVAALDVEGSQDFEQFKQGFGLFDAKFRTDALGVWDALATADSGLGNEGALIVDLKGEMPPIPGVPQELVDEGRFFRASIISPVTDRAKVSESWTKLDGSLKNIFKTVSELAGDEIPMQRPISSEKDGLITYFFSFPFFNDDFVPSVSVSDKWFVASTSKIQAVDLVERANAGAGSDRKGFWMEMNFDALRTFTGDWITLLEKNGEDVLGGPESYADFKKELPRIREGLAALEEFDEVTLSARQESGKQRTTLHFKVR